MVNPRQKNYSNLMLLFNDYFSVVIIIVLILFFAGAYLLVLNPKFIATQDAIRANISSEENLYAVSQKKLAVLLDIQKVYENIKPTDLQKFNSVLPGFYPADKLFGELEEIVSTGGWLVDGISFDVTDGKAPTDPKKVTKSILTDLSQYPGLEKINVTLSVSAINYAGLKRLLHLFENNLRLTDVTNVSFSPSDRTADLILNTYYYKEPL